jgi:AraC-like DNA-binding protein
MKELGQPATDASVERPPTDGIVWVGVLAPIPRLLAEEGFDPDMVLLPLGLTPDVLWDLTAPIAFSETCRILQHCADLTGIAHFGLLVGAREHPSMLGPLQNVVFGAASVQAALDAVCQDFSQGDRGGITAIDSDAGAARLGYSLFDPSIAGAAQMQDLAVAGLARLVHLLCGPQWRPIEARFAHPAPADSTPHTAILGCPVRFEAPRTEIVFDPAWLQAPVADPDPIIRELVANHLQELGAMRGPELIGQLRGLMPFLIGSHRATLGQIGAACGVGTAALGARLRSAGTSFTRLRDEANHDLACQLLEYTELPVADIARHLGYAGPASFGRAFARWSGRSATDWRAQAQARLREAGQRM